MSDQFDRQEYFVTNLEAKEQADASYWAGAVIGFGASFFLLAACLIAAVVLIEYGYI